MSNELPGPEKPDRDLRKYAATTNFRLVVGAIVLVFVVGLGIIAFIYGFQAALLGFICLLGAMVPIGLIVLLMLGLDKVVKRINK